MTPPKIAAAITAVSTLALVLAIQRIPVPGEQVDVLASTSTVALAQMPFETPDWAPDEATKISALKRAYEIDGSIQAGELAAHIVDPNDVNEIDVASVKAAAEPKLPEKSAPPNKPRDVCKIHGMRKVYTGDTWRCRK